MTDAFLGIEKSLTGKFWQPRLTDEIPAYKMAQRLDLPEFLARILVARGVTEADVKHFLEPRLRDSMPDPSELADMDLAAERLADAVESGECIGVFGDYDVDGATASALVIRYFQALDVRTVVHIPDRQTEGYGINSGGLVSLKDKGAGPIIAVDCGIVAFEPLAIAAQAGIEVVVIDHHIAETELPAAAAVINPNRLDDKSNLGNLAAVGVTFMTVVAVNRELRRRGWFRTRPEPKITQWLDLVALGTVCDAVPLTGLNRILVSQGLRVMRSGGNEGLSALARVASIQGKRTAWHAGFQLGPRINAGGRISRSDLGVRLLTTRDGSEAAGIAVRLNDLNVQRREIESAVLKEAFKVAESTEQENCVVAAGDGWHPGVIGIVASRLVERFNKPAVVIGMLDDGVGKGSGRSVAGVNLGAAISAAVHSGLLIKGGGHPMAAGLEIESGKLQAFTEHMNAQLAEEMATRTRQKILKIDSALSLNAVNENLVGLIEKVGPFGQGNAEPRFAFVDVFVDWATRTRGSHVSARLADASGKRIRAFAFQAADTPMGESLLANDGRQLVIAGRVQERFWNGERRIELTIDDAGVSA